MKRRFMYFPSDGFYEVDFIGCFGDLVLYGYVRDEVDWRVTARAEINAEVVRPREFRSVELICAVRACDARIVAHAVDPSQVKFKFAGRPAVAKAICAKEILNARLLRKNSAVNAMRT